MSRLGDFIAWLRFGGPDTMTTLRDSQGNEMDPSVLEGDEPEDLRDLDAEQKERTRWWWVGRVLRPRGGGWWWWSR